MCDSPVLCTQNGFGTGKANDNRHAFNYRVAVLGTEYGRPFEWDGQEKRKNFLDGREYFMGTTGGGDVSNRFDFNGRGT